MSPSISAVGGGEEVIPLMTTVDEEEVPLPLRVLSGPLYPKLSTCFEGAQLTQLVQLVTAGRLFPCHEGRVNLL